MKTSAYQNNRNLSVKNSQQPQGGISNGYASDANRQPTIMNKKNREIREARANQKANDVLSQKSVKMNSHNLEDSIGGVIGSGINSKGGKDGSNVKG